MADCRASRTLAWSEWLDPTGSSPLPRVGTPGSNRDDDFLVDVKLRRAVSGAYYAVSHQINGDAARLLAPNVSQRTNHRIQRWFGHAEVKATCVRFLPAKLGKPLYDLIGESASLDMQTLARNFIELQEARHRADYDLSYQLVLDDATPLLTLAEEASAAWQQLQGTHEANIFILSLEELGRQRTSLETCGRVSVFVDCAPLAIVPGEDCIHLCQQP